MMPHLVKFLLRHAAIGMALACAVVAALMVSDAGHVGTLIRGAENGWLVAAILTAAMGLTFASAQMGIAVMLLTEEPPSDGDGLAELAPISVPRRR